MSKKIQETTQRDIDQAFRSICEILNEICIDDIKQLLEDCFEHRNKETNLDVDISESEDEDENNFRDIDRTSDISEDDYEGRMDEIDNETVFT
tara:strand:- start:512 stop:790 length:279 start_codon:yes stop_codon:yes gene_type:complete